jgi:hypothetical protein
MTPDNILKIHQLTLDCDSNIAEGLRNWALDVRRYAARGAGRQSRLITRLLDTCNPASSDQLLDTLAGVAAIVGARITVPGVVEFATYQDELETTREAEEIEADL